MRRRAFLALTILGAQQLHALALGRAALLRPAPAPLRPAAAPHRIAPLRAIAAAPLGGSLTADALKVLYDGQCMVCLTNKALLSFFERWRPVKRLEFVNIRDPGYAPSEHGGVAYDDAMRHFHVIDGATVAEGSEAVLLAYGKVGLGWLMAVLRFPLIRWAIDALYAVVSRHRYTISRLLPGGAQLASAVASLKDVETAAQGGGCDEEEECMLDYDDDEDEDEVAPAVQSPA